MSRPNAVDQSNQSQAVTHRRFVHPWGYSLGRLLHVLQRDWQVCGPAHCNSSLFAGGHKGKSPGRLQCHCTAAHASGRPPPHAARASLPNIYTGLWERSGPLPPLQPPLASDGAAVRAQPPSSLEPPCREALAAQLLTGCACGRLQRPVQPGRRCRRSLQPPPPLDLAGGAGPWRQL